MSNPTFDQFDAGILSVYQKARYQIGEISQGDFIKNKDGLFARVTYVWDDGVQTTKFSESGEGGSFHLGASGRMSYSGALEPSLPKTHLRKTGNYKKGRAWIWHRGNVEAHNGVDVECLVQVWEVLDDSQAVDESKPSRWIVNPKSQYNGGGHSHTYTTFDGVERVAYRGGQTLAEYLAEKPDYIVMTESEFDERLAAHYESQKTIPQECTEEHFFEMLEVLPPCRWHTVAGVNCFHVSERLTGNLVNWFARRDGRYFEFTQDASITEAELTAIFKNANII